MGSIISEILSGYKKALDISQNEYEKLYTERAKNAKEFYDTFFSELIKDCSHFADSSKQRQIKRLVEHIFKSDEVKFAAIDGTCYKDRLGDYMVFFGGSYGIRGSIHFEGEPPKVKYEKWSSEQDVSMVAYVPVPFAELNDVSEEQFVLKPDEEKVNLLSIHTQIMQLAEIYLIYDLMKASSLRPKFILWDQTMSGILASNDIGTDNIEMIGLVHNGRKLNIGDVLIAYSHPYNRELGVPSTKKFRLYNYVLSRLFQESPLQISKLVSEIDIDEKEFLRRINKLYLKSFPDDEPIIKKEGDYLHLNDLYRDSWPYTLSLFDKFCEKLFKNKDQRVLMYETKEHDDIRKRWMSPNDLRFLISVGMRAIIEEAWKHDILLIGITKDSSARYLSRNYLGCMRYLKQYEFEDVLLPWTDRSFLEIIPLGDDNLNAPWTTIEYDSAFMTLHLEDINGPIRGVQGKVVNTERIIVKSLAQFYLKRDRHHPLMGHVIFIDRLLMPSFERERFETVQINEHYLGKVKPVTFCNNENENHVQDVTIYLLNILTRNLYPEVIGYPDPLHKADWGAKTLYKKVKFMIDSSGVTLRTRPLNKTFRRIRDEIRRI
ncbi:hypothetical protein MettiDRAFT_0595 [Methanolobus tindarius DSM 2278]|uniref:NurA domain-containing protein n=1 Tax=Methanolobus tindarius DSM 2278 TaxID=1090322 RepID=W9DU36_METTI|nr:hypothetical protein [Methanolobus tindarius]ETA67182.1 hypothetical protein MettiDRAFT_0595 [Methanolobus tindarius DSM 2278]